MRILLVEDDETFAVAMRRGLTDEGFTVENVASVEQARASLAVGDFDMAVVDAGLPGDGGNGFLKALRKSGNTLPVVMVAARDCVSDRILTLDLGADDVLVKPFSLLELAARCRVVVRRVRTLASSELRVGGLHMDLSGRMASVDKVPVELTRREWCVLESLALRVGHVVSKEKLLHAIASWDCDSSINAVEMQVSRLRVKLGASVMVRTVRGEGYRLEHAG